MTSRPTRRELLALGASMAAAAGCRAEKRRDGRQVATLWFSYGGKNREVLLDLVKRFNNAQRNVYVDATYQGDYFEALAKLRTALAAGVAPSFTHVVGEVVPYLADANVLEPLDDYPGARNLDLVPALAQSGSYIGGADRPLVAVPFNRSTPIMYVNPDALAAARVAIPRTWDELREAARALTRRTADGVRWGFEVPIGWWFWAAMVGQAGGAVVGPRGEPTLGGDAGERALALWRTMVHRDGSMRPPPGRDFNSWSVLNQDYLAGRAAIVWTSTAFLRYLEENARFHVVAAPLPREVRASVPTGGTFFVALRSAPTAEKQAAWEFMRWMCEPAQTADWARRTGYLPVARAAVDGMMSSGYYASHPNDRVALDQLADVQPWPWAPNLFRVQRDIVEPRLEEAVLTDADPRTAMEAARRAAMEP